MTEGRRASPHFAMARLRGRARAREQDQRATYVQKQPEKEGTVSGPGEIVVDGKRYPFRDTQGINPQPGDTLTVRNVGRKAVVIMAPSEGTEVR